jgi:exopolysaccharide production protein ExoZ
MTYSNQHEKLSQMSFGIDLCRLIAISAVVAVHTIDFRPGRFGVQLFFVVSGYLLCDSLNRSSTFLFLKRRSLRLIPLAAVFSLLYFLTIGNPKSDLILNLTLLNNLTWSISGYYGLWSISNEFIFSLVIVLVSRIERKSFYFLLGITICLQLTSGFFSWYFSNQSDSSVFLDNPEFFTWLNTLNPAINLGFFLIGMGIRRNYISKVFSFYTTLLTVLICIIVDYILGHVMTLWMIATFMLFQNCKNRVPKNTVVDRTVSFIGQRTYGMYFSHFLIAAHIQQSEHRIFRFIFDSYPLYFFVVFFSSLVVSSITYKLFEKPIMALGKIQKTENT